MVCLFITVYIASFTNRKSIEFSAQLSPQANTGAKSNREAELECAVTEKEHQLNLIKEKLHMKSVQEDDQNAFEEVRQRRASELPASALSAAAKQQAQDLKNMLMIDTKDPNRPRFTLRELEKVLMEKNQLTVKLDQTKDELEHLRKQYKLISLFSRIH